MNWSDIVVIGIILGFGIIGLINGFILSIFRLASFFISVIVSVKFYPKVAEILMKSRLYEDIKASIYRGFILQYQGHLPASGGQEKQAAAQTVVDSLKLPGFFKQMLAKELPNPFELVDASKVIDLVSRELAEVIIGIISLVLIYILVRLGLAFLRLIFRGIGRLPLLRQIDKLGGFALGAAEGLLTVYILFTVLLLFNASPWFAQVIDAVENSLLAGFFYRNNFIINWMF